MQNGTTPTNTSNLMISPPSSGTYITTRHSILTPPKILTSPSPVRNTSTKNPQTQVHWHKRWHKTQKSITSCFGKHCTGIVNTRLKQFMGNANISHPFQGAFTKVPRGTNHIFVMNTLINQAKYMGHPRRLHLPPKGLWQCMPPPTLPKMGHFGKHLYQNLSPKQTRIQIRPTFHIRGPPIRWPPLPPTIQPIYSRSYLYFQNRMHPPPPPYSSIQFSDNICNFSTTPNRKSINSTIKHCHANRLKVNISKSCHTAFNNSGNTPHPDIIIDAQALKFDPKPCYLGLCLSNSKSNLNSFMIGKVSRAAYALRYMLDNAASAKTINQLFS